MRENNEKITTPNMAFQLEIQKLKAQLKSGPRGPSSLKHFKIECLSSRIIGLIV